MTGTGKTMAAVLFAAGMLAFAPANWAFAAGDAGGTAGKAGSDAATVKTKCADGKVWDPDYKGWFTKGKCVDAAEIKKPKEEKQGMIYDYGRWLAQSGEFGDAIAVLKQAPDQEDPRVLNYLGYSNRKLGNMDTALAYYRAAVAKNPDFTLVREYLGEAYVQLGALEQAREQLSEIERICESRTCGEYGQLAEMIVNSQLQ